MSENRSLPSDEGDADDADIEDLRRCNPVDASALPSSHSTDAMRTLEQILESVDESEPGSDESSAAGDRDKPEGAPPGTAPRQ